MHGLVEHLESFNAKERYWLWKAATGIAELAAPFRTALGDAAGVEVPANAWWAIDYHLDWLEGALLSCGRPVEDIYDEPEPGRNLNRNQEDVDLIVAWARGSRTAIVILEAKGATPWSNSQYGSKVRRLVTIFGEDGRRHADVDPRFVLASPTRPTKLSAELRPACAGDGEGRPRWIPLVMPATFQQPERCDPTGKPRAEGVHWHVRPRRVPAAEV